MKNKVEKIISKAAADKESSKVKKEFTPDSIAEKAVKAHEEYLAKKAKNLQTLIKIADDLDRAGNTEDASAIDEIIKDESAVEYVDIPADEYEELQNVYKALGESLK